MGQGIVNSLRLVTGLVLFSYVALHLTNLSLGLVSIQVMDVMLAAIFPFLSHPATQGILLGSLLIHFALALHALYKRRTLKMPPKEALQMLLGFAIPFMLVLHVSKTRIVADLHGAHITYAFELVQFWVRDPLAGIEQAVLLVTAWTHACIGLFFVMRTRRWFSALSPILLIVAFTIPFLAILGYVRAGVVVMELARDPAWLAALDARTAVPAHAKPQLLNIANSLRLGVLALIVAVLVARIVRRLLNRMRGTIKLTYGQGRRLRVPRGTSILEASRLAGIPHASICGGRGRCSTCRTHVSCEKNRGGLPGPSSFERDVLKRMNLPGPVRLACQFRPDCDVTVSPMLSLSDANSAMFNGSQIGTERELAVLFCDLRGFTKLSENKLPYDIVFLLNRYFEAMGVEIKESGGYLDKFMGDGLMALFGMDCDPRTAARQSLAAAVRMSRRLDFLNDAVENDLLRGLKIGIGIHSGTAVLGEMGWGRAKALTAIGDCVNAASRLESLTKEYGVELIVSESIERNSGLDLCRWPTDEVIVKGRTTPLAIRTFRRASELARAKRLAAAAA